MGRVTPSPNRIKKRWRGSCPPHSREKGGKGVTLPVPVKKTWGGSLPPPFASEQVGRVTPSPFAATLRQKIKIEKKKFNGRTFAPVFHPSMAMFSSCPCVFASRSVCRKGGKRGNGWEEGRKREIRDGRRKGGRYVTSTVTSLNNEFMKT